MKIGRTRRSWSPREEEVLLSAMKGLVVTRWKTDNGFRGGYLSRLLEALKREFPRFNLYNDYKIDCDNDQWEQIIRVDKDTRNMRTIAVDLVEMSKENNKSSPQGMDQSASDSDHETQSSKKKNKKHKVVDRSNILLEMLAKSNEDINSRLDKLINRIGYEFDVSKSRNEVFAILEDIQGLTLGQQLDVVGIILEKVQRLDLFMSLPEVFRHMYMVCILKKQT
ncbi:hypothetical protein SASPL_154507 [Salvia splendens]|uniref:Myb/SANT-like domain-containing protein n=1 Tax=Salvia splendens TaxID=180675 RepID=A0A8X8W087_SALSN|nr:hypothetical protein SASPL_154507 [Salvia splendens]